MSPFRTDSSTIIAATESQREYIPKLRFLHRVNTMDCSSGSPCFDKSFVFFGIHQGIWGEKTNRGVPLTRIIESIENDIGNLPLPMASECSVLNLGLQQHYLPVIGCDDFQSMIWRCAQNQPQRLIIIAGNEGKGKSFRIQLLSHMLDDAEHLKLNLQASKIAKMDALFIAKEICRCGETVPDFVDFSEEHSTVSIWLQEELLPKVMACIDKARNGRLVWITITDMNKYALDGAHASVFLMLLSMQLLSNEWLRLVLDGMRSDLPTALLPIRVFHNASDATSVDIRLFLERSFTNFGAELHQDLIRFLVDETDDLYAEALARNPATAMSELQITLAKKVQIALKKINS